MEESKDLDWVITNEADAKAGLETENRYYAVIDIPSDFSQNVATAEDIDKVPATITYSANEKRNYIASTIEKCIKRIVRLYSFTYRHLELCRFYR